MTNLRRLVITVGMALTITGIACADAMETQTFSLPSSGPNTSDWTSGASISQFDTSLGTLQSISFLVSVNTTVSGSATDNNGAGLTNYLFTGTVNVYFGDDSNPSPANDDLFALDAATSANVQFKNETQGSIMTVNPVSESASGLAMYSGITGAMISGNGDENPINLSLYEGSSIPGPLGTVELYASTLTNDSFSGGAYTQGSAGGTITLNATVTYDYIVPPPPSSTPEPATMALFGTGLIGLGLLRRRAVKK